MSTAQPAPTEQNRRLQVFLCHASGDKQFVRDLYARLEADGFAPWLDEKELLPGQKWQEEIPAAVRKSDVVIVCLSRKSVNKEGYVQREIGYALDAAEEKPEGTIFVIPARIEEVDVPKRLSERQWANLFSNDGYKRLLAALDHRAQALGLPQSGSHLPRETVAEVEATIEEAVNSQPLTTRNVTAETADDQAQSVPSNVVKATPAPTQPPVVHRPETKDIEEAVDSQPLTRRNVTVEAADDQAQSVPSNVVKAAPAPTQPPIVDRPETKDAEVGLSAEQMYTRAEDYWLKRNYRQALQWYQEAAAAGDIDAMAALGTIYECGQRVTQDETKARHWYQKAAHGYLIASDTGACAAMYNLGFLYEAGCGVTQDYQQARHWYQKAADAGDPMGMANLGALYDRGLGVTQDYQQARHWYQKAADAGDPTGMVNLGGLYEEGRGLLQDFRQARYWYQKAADSGDRNAMYNLGILYEYGQGVAQSYQQACSWYRKAADAGAPDALKKLEQ